jgi:hypothetical protein
MILICLLESVRNTIIARLNNQKEKEKIRSIQGRVKLFVEKNQTFLIFSEV